MRLSAAERAVTTGTPVVAPRRLWLGILLAPSAWMLAELIGYYLSSRNCEPFHGGVPLGGTGSAEGTHFVVVIVFAACAAWGLWLALTSWGTVRRDHDVGDPPAWGRARFMAFGGVLVSALFLLGILLFGFSGFVVQACSQVRGA